MTSQKSTVGLVTGGCSKIGTHITKWLHSHNYNLCIHYSSNKTSAEKLAEELNQSRPDSAFIYQLNFASSSISEVQKMVDETANKWGQFDLLVNNASVFNGTSLEDGQLFEADYDQQMTVNVKIPALLIQSSIKYLKVSKIGCIVNLCDVHGLRPLHGFMSYSVSKAAIISLTQCMAKELGESYGIRVNGISPGAIFPAPPGIESSAVAISKNVFKKFGNVESILSALKFLLESDFVTGQIINVDGGSSLNQ
ncbi:pteridine reductase 1-like [Symsagittifera roscoffensis]|uniref:pteridine reductase 1-like n=1 Tax=Symsagittifera roscoffensis TaxID=84072 RepID=UPI00307C2114